MAIAVTKIKVRYMAANNSTGTSIVYTGCAFNHDPVKAPAISVQTDRYMVKSLLTEVVALLTMPCGFFQSEETSEC